MLSLQLSRRNARRYWLRFDKPYGQGQANDETIQQGHSAESGIGLRVGEEIAMRNDTLDGFAVDSHDGNSIKDARTAKKSTEEFVVQRTAQILIVANE